MEKQKFNILCMKEALQQAKLAYNELEVPVGAVIAYNNKIIAYAYNKREQAQNSLLHAEILAINEACQRLGSWRLEACDIYITLEPCPMCAGAIINSRISKVYFGAYDYKNGCCGSVTNLFDLPFTHKPQLNVGLLQDECSQILSDFFKKLRQK